MARVRVDTTVDSDLLGRAREALSGSNDSAVLDEALRALLARHRDSGVELANDAYDDHPLDELDGWGIPAAFRETATTS